MTIKRNNELSKKLLEEGEKRDKEKENKWKPSEEQMGALNEWLKNHQYDRDSRYYYPIFQSLYNDLKTL